MAATAARGTVHIAPKAPSYQVVHYAQDRSREHSRRINMVVALIFLALAATWLAFLPPGSKPFIAIFALGFGSAVTLIALNRLRYFYRFEIDFKLSEDSMRVFQRDYTTQFLKDIGRQYYFIDDIDDFHTQCENAFQTLDQNVKDAALKHLEECGCDEWAFTLAVKGDKIILNKDAVLVLYRERRKEAILKYLGTIDSNPQVLYGYLMQGVVADFVLTPVYQLLFNRTTDPSVTYTQQINATSANTGMRLYRNEKNDLCLEVVQKYEKIEIDQGQVLRYYLLKANVNINARTVQIDGEKLARPPQHVSEYFSNDS